ncbi:hypothetical protein CBR_g55400 [Chara braunii]|uniref:Uncharacterized protein n=1 Tax=Chara braunii TaxID=69332 RepID=A0A388K7P7_CHABU|nr:hypothetical protein CBR_g55400 [Chara braunii]|eukprot:GBG66057.1 hypothetical protein CBR_g55400 [Chara braunii]
MSMSVAQVEKALAEVMKYAAEGIHYNGDIEFSLLKKRVSRYVAVSVDMRSTIMANDEGCVKARMLLQRLRESPHVRVDNEVEHSPYSLKGVIQWMCNEGMREDGDVDMTMHQKGGTYAPANFKKLLGTVAENSDMLVDGSKDELKSGDVLCDFMKKSDEDRNVIHEALHEVTEFDLQGKDLIEFVPARGEDDFISGIPLWGDLLSRILDRLSLASCDVERQREREEGPFMSLRTLNSHRARACPVVVDERAQGQEIGVVDACGPSNIGAVNLMSDESEDIGAPENVDGEGGSFPEQQPPPAESFDSFRKLAALIFSVRGGVGMSQSHIDALLSLLKDPRFSTTDIAYCNSRECLTWAGSLAEAAGWKESDLRSDDWPRDAHAILWHRYWRTTFLSIFNIALQKCKTVFSLEVSPPSEDLSISGPRSGALSYHIESIIRANKGVDGNGNPRYIIPLSLYSDKTHMDGCQKQMAYPLMMSLADHASEATLQAYLPVLHHLPRDKGWGQQSTAFRKQKAVILHKALTVVLQSAKKASHDGIMIPTTRFVDITVHPFLLNYIQDYPERCALATVKFGVCPTCTVSKTDFDVLADFTDCKRSQTLETHLTAVVFTSDDIDVRRAAEGRMSELNMHRHVQKNGLWGFYRGPNGDDPQLDDHLALQPDRMHTIEHGIFLHMIDAFRTAAFDKFPNIPQTEILKELDASGADNRPPRAPEKRSQEDQITKVHRRTKKRISYKKDTTVDMIDLRGSNNVHSGAREEAEEEHDHPSSEKFDREDDNASRDEVDDSETSHGHPRDTDEADDDDGGSDDGTAYEESDDGSAQDDRSASRRASSPSPGGTQCTRVPGRNTTHEGSAADTLSIGRQIVRHANTAGKGKQSALKLPPLPNDYIQTRKVQAHR